MIVAISSATSYNSVFSSKIQVPIFVLFRSSDANKVFPPDLQIRAYLTVRESRTCVSKEVYIRRLFITSQLLYPFARYTVFLSTLGLSNLILSTPAPLHLGTLNLRALNLSSGFTKPIKNQIPYGRFCSAKKMIRPRKHFKTNVRRGKHFVCVGHFHKRVVIAKNNQRID